MRVYRASLAVLVAAFAVTAAAAQNGGLKVRVCDAKDNSPLPGATVVLSHATGNVATTTQLSDATGYVLFPVLRAGSGYIVEVSFPGYAKVHIADDRTRVRISQTIELPVCLSDEIQEKIEVVGTREVVDLEKTETSTRFSDEFIKDLPVQGRFYQNVLTLAPGVSDEDGDGNPNVNGARSRDFKAIVGGVSNQDPFTGQFLNFVNPDSIEEIEVVTAGAGVEYGRAQGGFANIVQKQGTNEFEGLFSMLYSSSKLDGNGATNLSGRRVPSFQSIQPAVQVSGPIVKDRLWYVLSHEYHKDEVPVNTLRDVVVVTRTQPINSDVVTWQASPRNKLTFKYQFDPITLTNLFVSSVRPAANAVRQEVGGPVYSMQWTAPYSPKLLVDSTVAYQDSHTNVLPMTFGVPNDCVTGYDAVEFSDCINLDDGSRSGSFFLIHRDERQRLTVRSQAELYGGKFWGMSHQFKFGFIVEGERYFRNEHRSPLAFFQSFVGRENPGGDLERKALAAVLFSVPDTFDSRATGTTWGIYGEDQIKPLNNLTITLGLRYDREYISTQGVLPFDPVAESQNFLDRINSGQPSPVSVQQAFTAYEGVHNFLSQLSQILGFTPEYIDNTTSGIVRQSAFWERKRRPGDIRLSNNNVSPFIGASWDPWSDSKTKFGFTLGRHYNNIPLIIPTLELEPASTFVSFDARFTPGVGFEVPIDSSSGTPLNLGGRFGINPAVNLNVVDRGLKTPYQDELTLSFEREITAETLLRLTYIKRKFRDQLQDVDINHAPGDYGHCVLQSSPGDPFISGAPDGILDDCTGRFVQVDAPGTGDDERITQQLVQRPDGFLDTYLLNPGFGQVFMVGNFNKIDYKGLTLELERRLYRGWEINGSYTWSEAIGDGEDFNEELGDDRSTLSDETGFQGYDATHSVKVNATTITPWGFRLGGTVSWQSGLPYSILDRRNSLDPVPPQYNSFGVSDEPRARRLYTTHRRNDQRNAPYWLFNTKVSKEMNLKGGKNLQISAEVFNLLNTGPVRIQDQTNGRNDSTLVSFGRHFQMGAKLTF